MLVFFLCIQEHMQQQPTTLPLMPTSKLTSKPLHSKAYCKSLAERIPLPLYHHRNTDRIITSETIPMLHYHCRITSNYNSSINHSECSMQQRLQVSSHIPLLSQTHAPALLPSSGPCFVLSRIAWVVQMSTSLSVSSCVYVCNVSF